MSRILIGAGLTALILLTACGDKTADAPKPVAPAAAVPVGAGAAGASAGVPKAGAAAAAAGTPAGAAPAGGGAPGAPGAAGGPPPAAVGVIKVQSEAANLTTELPGRVEALRVAQIRARVAGIVQKRLFQEGSDVKEGQVLYQLDPAPFRAALESAQAALQRSEATLAQNKAQADRMKPLVDVNAVSKQEYSNAVAAQKQSEADIAAGRAAVKIARINLDYTNVKAPISGRIGRTLVTEGALVGQGEATQMAMVQQISPLFVNFTQPVADVIRLRQSIAAGKIKASAGAQAGAVQVLLEDGSAYSKTGKLLFSDLSVDQTSGQVTLRAEVPNPDGILLPGMYVRVRVQQARYDSVVLIPQQALQRSGQGESVMVVDDKGEVSSRPVKVGSATGNKWIITDGLKEGELVMVDGFQKLRPGAPVKPVPWQPPGSAPGPAPTAGAGGAVAAAGKDTAASATK